MSTHKHFSTIWGTIVWTTHFWEGGKSWVLLHCTSYFSRCLFVCLFSPCFDQINCFFWLLLSPYRRGIAAITYFVWVNTQLPCTNILLTSTGTLALHLYKPIQSRIYEKMIKLLSLPFFFFFLNTRYDHKICHPFKTHNLRTEKV